MRMTWQMGFSACLVLPGLWFTSVMAGQQVSNVSEMVSVQANCQVVGGIVTMSFGSYDPAWANIVRDLDSSSSFSVRCTPGTTARITMDDGAHPSGESKRMVNGIGEALVYQIYTSPSRTTPWNATNAVTYAANTLLPQTFTVYGRIPAGQGNVDAGSYSDTVTITVTF